MAWIRRRTRSDGLVSLAVQWRDVRGKLQSETFREADAAAANEFLRLVEGSGGDWPPRWIKGEGFPFECVECDRARCGPFVGGVEHPGI